MEINNTGGAALFALQQAMGQPRNLVDLMVKSTIDPGQLPSPSSGNAKLEKAAAVQTGKGTRLNIMA